MVEFSKRISALGLRLLPRKTMSRGLGAITRLSGVEPGVSRAIELFAATYKVDLDEAEIPEGGFKTFNEFFTRALRPGARVIDPSPEVLISPSDGEVAEMGRVAPDQTLTIKGKPYRVDELLGGDPLSARFSSGSHATIYLSPRDYHRVHAPVSGKVLSIEYLGGTLYPVNSIGTEYIPQLFARNERVAVIQESETHGLVATILVGAIGVGRMSLSFDDLITNSGAEKVRKDLRGASIYLEKGDELGRFNLGSTVILFVEGKIPLDFNAVLGESIRMGERLATRSKP